MTRSPEEWLQQEPVRLLRDYVRIDTTHARGDIEGVQFLRPLLDCGSIETEIVCPAPRRCNLLARLPGRTPGGRAAALEPHRRRSRSSPSYWREAAPFEGKIKGGFLYGRGAYDMKSLGLAQALALRRWSTRDRALLRHPLSGGGGRGGGSALGVAVAPRAPAGMVRRTSSAVLNEGGTNEMILRDVRFWGIETVQAGYGILQLEASAPGALQDVAGRWPKLSGGPVEPLPHVVHGFDMLANHLGHPLTDPLRHLDRVRRDPAELAILPDRYAAFSSPASVGRRPLPFRQARRTTSGRSPSVSHPAVARPLRLPPLDRGGARRSVRVFGLQSSGPTTASPYPTPLTELLRQVVEARHPGSPVRPCPDFGGSTTSIYFRQRGIAAYGFSPVAANITDSAGATATTRGSFCGTMSMGLDISAESAEGLAVHLERKRQALRTEVTIRVRLAFSCSLV